MKYIFTLALTLVLLQSKAQEINKKIEDKIKHKQVMLNLCSKEGLLSFPEFKDSYDTHYSNYQVDSTSIVELKKLIADKTIKIVLGTWCGDSKLHVPHFLKVLDAVKFNESQLVIIGVDGDKKAEAGLLDGLKIERVPTFIVLDTKGIEMGRITESPRKTIEQDLIEMLKKK